MDLNAILPGGMLRLLGFVDYLIRPGRRRAWLPMNGQERRQELVESMIARCRIGRIVETGTYRGDTTVWLARFGLPTITIEINPRWFEFARLRLRKLKHVIPCLGDSVEVLKDLVPRLADKEAPTLFYLDAHWRERLPLREELELITRHFAKSVVVIDDFEVPGDPGYGFDDYGPGKRLALD